jgi:hypothetical protein
MRIQERLQEAELAWGGLSAAWLPLTTHPQ